MAKHPYHKVRKDSDRGDYRIMEKLPGGRARTIARSDDRVKANQSAGIRSSGERIRRYGRKS